MNELKPCPFCGCNEILNYSHSSFNGIHGYHLFCTKCHGGTKVCDTHEEAIKAWNNRYSLELKEFFDKLIKNQESLPPEFEKVLNENFWDLLA